DHGRPPPRGADRGCAVPSGICADRSREAAAAELSGAGRGARAVAPRPERLREDGIVEIKDAIRTVVGREDLTEAEAHLAMGQVMDGQATPDQIPAIITALPMKGDMRGETAGLSRG